MITDRDIEKLKAVFATREDILGMGRDISILKEDVSGLKKDMSGVKTDLLSTNDRIDRLTTIVVESRQEIRDLREDVDGLKEITQGLIISVDGITKSISDMRLEYSAIGMQLTRHEKWHHQTAGKLNLKLEY